MVENLRDAVENNWGSLGRTNPYTTCCEEVNDPEIDPGFKQKVTLMLEMGHFVNLHMNVGSG